jgi:regulator of nucleoside diphosphate kinase
LRKGCHLVAFFIYNYFSDLPGLALSGNLNLKVMNKIIVNKLDYLRILKHIREAREKKTIEVSEAEKLQNELMSAMVLEPQEIPNDVVTMNSVVKISFAEKGKQAEFKIVYPDEANFRERKVSIFSPIATALIGFRIGDLVEWALPGGLTKIRIDEITYQPEAAGDYTL